MRQQIMDYVFVVELSGACGRRETLDGEGFMGGVRFLAEFGQEGSF